MNVFELSFLAGIFLGGVWGFSVCYQHGPVFGLVGATIGVTVGLAGAILMMASWIGLLTLWGRSKLQNVLPEAASGLIVVALSVIAIAGVPLLLASLIKAAFRAMSLAGGG